MKKLKPGKKLPKWIEYVNVQHSESEVNPFSIEKFIVYKPSIVIKINSSYFNLQSGIIEKMVRFRKKYKKYYSSIEFKL